MTERDAELDAFVAAFAARIDRDVARAAPVPDIADVWARVAAIDESLVPEDLELDDDEDAVVPLARARALLSSSERDDLAPFAAALRGRVETQLHERGMSEIPARKLRAVRTSTALFAIAAALVLAVLGGFVVVRARMLGTSDTPRTAHRMLAPDDNWVPRTPAQAVDRVPAPKPATVVETPIETPAIEAPAPTPRVRTVKPNLDAELDELEARAQALWKAGDLSGAEKLLREVIRRARKGVRVELAYGDLFAIARQRGGASAQVAVWREYLRRSPDGRFADDVQAGLCRHAPSAAAADCWADYLRARPKGAHAKEARKTSGLAALDPDEGAP